MRPNRWPNNSLPMPAPPQFGSTTGIAWGAKTLMCHHPQSWLPPVASTVWASVLQVRGHFFSAETPNTPNIRFDIYQGCWKQWWPHYWNSYGSNSGDWTKNECGTNREFVCEPRRRRPPQESERFLLSFSVLARLTQRCCCIATATRGAITGKNPLAGQDPLTGQDGVLCKGGGRLGVVGGHGEIPIQYKGESPEN
jgi:hypothetical protein